jgi:DNA-binding transcriptional regulator LsrR (DeoR family)
MTSEMKQQQIDWRRARVLELSSEGYTRTEICQKLQLDRVTVHRDIQFLRQQALDTLHKHIHETIPEEYQRCLTGINQVLKMAWTIATKDIDNKTKLQALSPYQ